MKKFNPAKVVTSQAVVWQRSEDGKWERHLIREQKNESPLVSRLISVPVGIPVCLSCLSTNVMILPSAQYAEGEMRCHSCKARYGFVL
jgi:hypothetical protein